MDNFRHVAHMIERVNACVRVHDERMLAGAVYNVISDSILREDMAGGGLQARDVAWRHADGGR